MTGRVRKIAAGRLGPAGSRMTASSDLVWSTLHDQLNKLEREITEWRTVGGVAVQRPRDGVSLAAWNHMRNARALATQLAEQLDVKAVTLEALVSASEAARDQREET